MGASGAVSRSSRRFAPQDERGSPRGRAGYGSSLVGALSEVRYASEVTCAVKFYFRKIKDKVFIEKTLTICVRVLGFLEFELFEFYAGFFDEL